MANRREKHDLVDVEDLKRQVAEQFGGAHRQVASQSATRLEEQAHAARSKLISERLRPTSTVSCSTMDRAEATQICTDWLSNKS